MERSVCVKDFEKGSSCFKIAFSRRIKEAAQDLLCWEGKEKTNARCNELKGFRYPHKYQSKGIAESVDASNTSKTHRKAINGIYHGLRAGLAA